MGRVTANKRRGEYERHGIILGSWRELNNSAAGNLRLEVTFTDADGETHTAKTASDTGAGIDVRNATSRYEKGKPVSVVFTRAGLILGVNAGGRAYNMYEALYRGGDGSKSRARTHAATLAEAVESLDRTRPDGCANAEIISVSLVQEG